jgi:hypothetical protein
LRRTGWAAGLAGGRDFTWRRTKTTVAATAIIEEIRVSIEFS